MSKNVCLLSWDLVELNGSKVCIIQRLISWVKAVGELLADAYNPDQIPEVGQLDKLETFVRSKKIKSGARSAVDHEEAGILGWVLGDHSSETFTPLWGIVASWQCYFMVTDGWSVYPGFIPPGEKNCQ